MRVQQIQATRSAFAAVLEDGSVITSGNPAGGGDSSNVREQLVRVKQIQATRNAFAAILHDGSVVTWGDPEEGGDSSQVQEQLARVQQIQATQAAFAALGNGMVTWGHPSQGGDKCARAAGGRPTDPSNQFLFCGYLGRRLCGQMGPLTLLSLPCADSS